MLTCCKNESKIRNNTIIPVTHSQESDRLSSTQLSISTMMFLTLCVSHFGEKVAEVAAPIHLLSISSHNVAAAAASIASVPVCVIDVSAWGFRRTPDVEIRKLFLIRRRNNRIQCGAKAFFGDWRLNELAPSIGFCWARRTRARHFSSRAGSCSTLPTKALSSEMT